MDVLVTGAAGFIGFHLSLRLLRDGHRVVGLDNLNDYYDVRLKKDRLKHLAPFNDFSFQHLDLVDRTGISALFSGQAFDRVIHLAAQAGVRHSLEDPYAYAETNIVGFLNILEGCRRGRVPHLVYASSSSVYGLNSIMPYSVRQNADHPVSLYGASKKANELMAHTYSHIYGLPTTGLRFFTVYGPWGRPDMALFLFVNAILNDRPIKVFNQGDLYRDFTYIDDIIEGVSRIIDFIPRGNPDWRSDAPDPASSPAPYRLFNIGNNQSVRLTDFIEIIEDALGKKAEKEPYPMQPGDVYATYAEIDDLHRAVGFQPGVALRDGIRRYVAWYLDYYRVGKGA